MQASSIPQLVFTSHDSNTPYPSPDVENSSTFHQLGSTEQVVPPEVQISITPSDGWQNNPDSLSNDPEDGSQASSSPVYTTRRLSHNTTVSKESARRTENLPFRNGTPRTINDWSGEISDSESSAECSDGTESDDLANQIVATLYTRGQLSRGQYYPERMLTNLVKDEQAIRNVLTADRNARGETESLVSWCKQNARIFALTLLSHDDSTARRQAIYRFQSKGFTDDKLPVSNLHAHSKHCIGGNKRKTSEKCMHSKEASVFHHAPWKPKQFDNFYVKQWSFCVPKFDQDKFTQEFNESVVLPFVNVESGSVGEGSFGEVRAINMLADHQTILHTHGEPIIKVAQKEFKQQTGELGDNRQNWKRESEALAKFNKLDSPHIIRAVGAYTQSDKFYILMEWADGGDLRKVWRNNPDIHLRLTSTIVLDFLTQMRGLAYALSRMHDYTVGETSEQVRDSSILRSGHEMPGGLKVPTLNTPNPESTSNWRHGDLKPANILSFANSRERVLGTLKLADLGRARQHVDATKDRSNTVERCSTPDYDPPEVGLNLKGERSRFVDIWSFGCVLLESLIWLLFGTDELHNFTNRDPLGIEKSRYWSIEGGRLNGKTKCNGITTEWMGRLLREEPECQPREGGSAILDLILLIKDKLLVIKYPRNYRNQPEAGFRINSEALVSELDKILQIASTSPGYLLSGHGRKGVAMPKIAQVGMSLQSEKRTPAPWQARPLSRAYDTYKHDFDNDWHYEDDRDFVSHLFAQLSEDLDQLLQTNGLSVICNVCQSVNVNSPVLQKELACLTSQSTTTAKYCFVCDTVLQRLLHLSNMKPSTSQAHSLTERENGDWTTTIFLKRRASQSGSSIINDMVPPCFSLPLIPRGGSRAHYKILHAWLNECDTNHNNCRPRRESSCPTRIIDVGTTDSPCLRLMESSLLPEVERRDLKYIALSYPWGLQPPHQHFVTTKDNIAKHKDCIPDELPQTLADAVEVCRQLCISYLWVDSLCIIQGSGGDFAQEADRMESVFSSAYCVIAASSAEGTSSGFLRRHSRREIGVATSRNEIISGQTASTTISDAKSNQVIIVEDDFDDFERDVLQSPLNDRGWVFQERALARRTIYFTNNQTYFECGDGIRCETLTKMKHTHVGFLGDPNFPQYGLQGSKGADIIFYQDLYEEYSKKSFSNPEDRPFAISGLEQRLGQALSFKSQSGRGYWGIIDGHWGRSLLWRRATSVDRMHRLVKGPTGGKPAPSWSWQGYSGAINYLKPAFRTVNWHSSQVKLPWANSQGQQRSMTTASYQGQRFLIGMARECKIPQMEEAEKDIDLRSHDIVFDDPATSLRSGHYKVLVLGHLNIEGSLQEKIRNYVLLLEKIGLEQQNIYQRVGAGFLDGSMIDFEGPQESVLVE